MSELLARTNRLGVDLVAPLTVDTDGHMPDGPGQVVAATPATAAAVAAGVTVAGAGAVGGYVAEEAADG